jgi:hypothetical protein
MKLKKITGALIIYSVVKCLLHFGIDLFITGMFLDLRAPLYIDLELSMNPLPYDVNRVKIIGRNISTFDVVSSIITAKE